MISNDYAAQTDRELVIGTANHDERAFAALYERYFDDLYDFAIRLLRDPDAATEVTEHTFAEVHQSLPGHHVPDSVRAWLYSLALGNATSAARQTAAAPPTTDAAAQDLAYLTEVNKSRLPGREEVAQDTALRDLVWQSASQLGPREQAILDMNLRRGLSSAEIGEGLLTSPQAADASLSNLRQSFDNSFATKLLLVRGRDACSALATLLQHSAAPQGSPAVQQAVQSHTIACETCQATLQAYPPPADVFAAFSLVRPPAGLKEIVWGNLASAAPAAVAVPTDTPRRRSWARIMLILLGVLAAIGIPVLLFFLLSGGGGDGELKDPDDVRSTSHKTGEPSEDNIVKVVWSRQDNVLAYSVDWSEEQFQLPDAVGDLSGNATDATSPALNPGDWYFHLRTQGKDGNWTSTVHIGPFEIVEPQASPTAEPTEEPSPTEEPTEKPTATQESPTETPTRGPTSSATATP